MFLCCCVFPPTATRGQEASEVTGGVDVLLGLWTLWRLEVDAAGSCPERHTHFLQEPSAVRSFLWRCQVSHFSSNLTDDSQIRLRLGRRNQDVWSWALCSLTVGDPRRPL